MLVRVGGFLLVVVELVLHISVIGRLIKLSSLAAVLTVITVVSIHVHLLPVDFIRVVLSGGIAALDHALPILLYLVEEVRFVIEVGVPAVGHLVSKRRMLLGKLSLLPEALFLVEELLQSVLHHHFLNLSLLEHELLLELTRRLQLGGFVGHVRRGYLVHLDISKAKVVGHDLLGTHFRR